MESKTNISTELEKSIVELCSDEFATKYKTDLVNPSTVNMIMLLCYAVQQNKIKAAQIKLSANSSIHIKQAKNDDGCIVKRKIERNVTA